MVSGMRTATPGAWQRNVEVLREPATVEATETFLSNAVSGVCVAFSCVDGLYRVGEAALVHAWFFGCDESFWIVK